MASNSSIIFYFGAAIFFFMGLGLAFDAKHHSEAAADWEKLVLGVVNEKRGRPSRRKRLLWAYRLGGLFFSGIGILGAVAARWFPAWLPERFKTAGIDPMSRIMSGLLFVALGLLLASFKIGDLAKPSRLPGGLGDDMIEARIDWGRRLAAASGWLVLLCFLALGLFLLSRRG